MVLADGSGSWVCTCLVSGRVWETFSEPNPSDSIKIETAMQYLTRINAEIKQGGHRA